MLGRVFGGAAASSIAVFATASAWFMLPAFVFGVWGGFFAIIYLALSSDTNGDAGSPPTPLAR